MNLFLVLFVFSFSVSQFFAVEAGGRKHKHQEVCIGSDGKGHQLNQFWYDNGNCRRFYCYKDEDGLVIEQTTNCELAVAENDCRIKPGKAGRYPDCCPSVECPQESKAS
uniref:U-scoloptoxin(16)-Sm1a n=1 Tax=Scolopendra morsitans TaxID=943129 RepID=TXG1A_SCOMO|nr:RecName: Full=U-scoloptoxin(16)-Sm1a; Short=U-SLPTX(16)-Sm1a; Flags: Precursor [Scolopendra morsitans]